MTCWKPTSARPLRAPVMWLCAALALAACGMRDAAAPVAAPAPLAPVAGAPVAAAVGGDGLAAFAASAVPGQEGMVVENGVASRARLTRVYQAASGRECREVVFGTGPAQRARLACRGEDGVFAEARPLLRGGSR